jgi:hypothetical protein
MRGIAHLVVRTALALVVVGCSSTATPLDGGTNDASSDAPSLSIGCDLPENPGVMPHECALYYNLATHDHDEVMTKCTAPGSIVSGCPKAGLVGICHLEGAALGKSNIDVAFQLGLTGGAGAYEDEYRYNTTFGDSECAAAGGTWN